MSRKAHSLEALVRHGFDLLLELRRHQEAHLLLTQAVAYLKILLRDRGSGAQPILITVQALRIRES